MWNKETKVDSHNKVHREKLQVYWGESIVFSFLFFFLGYFGVNQH